MNGIAKIGLILLLASLFATGCDTQAVYTRESFSADSPFRLKVDDDLAVACESARRSLLGQGYLIDQADSEQVKGHKAYRVEGKANTFIEMNIACMQDGVGSTLYAIGVLSSYDLKKSSNPASVGLSGVGSISLPIGQSADSLVKVAEETIGDRLFYRRFFAAVEHTLAEMHAYARAAEKTEVEDSTMAVQAAGVIAEEAGERVAPADGPAAAEAQAPIVVQPASAASALEPAPDEAATISFEPAASLPSKEAATLPAAGSASPDDPAVDAASLDRDEASELPPADPTAATDPLVDEVSGLPLPEAKPSTERGGEPASLPER